MIDKSSIKLQKCTNARFVEVYEMHYLENGIKKRWEVVQSNDSVSILINNLDSAKLIIVRQFRPAVFLRNNDGYMFELCAGLVDKKGKSLEQIAREEVYEECGYEAQNLVKIGEFYSSVGTSGSKQSVFYTEVCNADKKTKGGGVDDEFIEIIEIPHSEVLDFLKTPNITPSLGFAFMWFLQNIESRALNSSSGASCIDFRNLGRFADSSPVSHPKFLKNSTTSTANTRIWDSKNVDSANSQNLVNLNPCEAPLNSPASWCKKSESKGAEVPPADFLLEAEKRGSPPKSEKAAAFWRVGGAGRGVQPFCEKESNEISGEGFAESIKESQGGLPRSHLLARNDEILDSSLRKCSAQNDNDFAESSAESNINLRKLI